MNVYKLYLARFLSNVRLFVYWNSFFINCLDMQISYKLVELAFYVLLFLFHTQRTNELVVFVILNFFFKIC